MGKYEDFDFLSWTHRKEIQPKIITYVDDYGGQIDLRLKCTQLDLTRNQSKKVLAEWCEFVPHSEVRTLYLYSRVPQVLFEAICQIPNLEGFFIKWSGNSIEDFSVLPQLDNLKRLYISTCTNLDDLTDISKLTKMEWLELHSLTSVSNIEPLRTLVNLKGLIYSG